MDLYVGNLPFETTEDELRQTFEPFGPIGCVILISDNFSERPLGFGFVELLDDQEGPRAIAQLDRTQFRGRTLIVSQTEPRIERRVTKATPCCVQAK